MSAYTHQYLYTLCVCGSLTAVLLVLLLAAVRKAVTDHVVMDAGFISGTFPQAPFHTP